MKLRISSFILISATGHALAASFLPGNLVLSRVGDGTNALASSGGPVSLLEYSKVGTLQQTLAISTTTTNGLQLSGTATSEGALSRSEDGTLLSIAGYIPPFTGTGSLANRTDAQAPRGYVTVGSDGVISSAMAIGAYSGNNIRSAVVSDDGAYFAGAITGTVFNNGSNTTIQGTVTNTRVVNIYNGNLYFSTASGANRGIYAFSGTPSTASTPTLIINMGGSSDAYDFVFNPSGDVAYVTNGNVVQRWTFNGLSWVLANTSGTIATGLTGLEVVFGTSQDSIFAVNPSTLYSLTFSGTSFGTTTTLATAGTNYAFRGLALAPVPEPGAAFLGSLGLLGLLRRRR